VRLWLQAIIAGQSATSVGGEPAGRDHNDYEKDDRNRDPSTTNAVAAPMWSTIQPKFIPKSPVMTVSEQKCRRGLGIDVG